jgi:hypothetical protein
LRLYEELLEKLLSVRQGEIDSLVLSLKGSAVRFKDGRWGIGAVPPEGAAVLSTREDHTRGLLARESSELIKLLASPYPQEYAAATAVAAALAPPVEGEPLESLLSLPGKDRVSLITPDPFVADFLRDWNWNISIFDDKKRGRNTLPEWTASQHLAGSGWLWITAECFRTRSFFSFLPRIKGKKVILQGPGAPFIPEVYGRAGISYLVIPRTGGANHEGPFRYIGAGGSPWRCPDLSWRVYNLSSRRGEQ